ncbi:hypothetical protein GCM10011297_21880 [Bacterioplanes sanyensis]|uniref:P-II family nitrogen regulator n=1 Tax=Bacterioplanes sanyensis TaxID=1249553 RepID=UPI00167420D8|nr:P-II family nitrogen regulator [Bacterioplanes sanyensis]GGY48532.1 hypothetical protein GCM10011297_21880 [Bacterioplanes sanyensis]
MQLHAAEKVVIITEKLIVKGVVEIIEAAGAKGYTIIAAGGKGGHTFRATSERAAVVDDFSDVKIEVIVNDKATAETIMNEVTQTYFDDYSGITYIEYIEVLRPSKF